MKNQFRDLTLVDLKGPRTLVIACDSSAGIGNKPLDTVQIDPAVTAAYSLRVPLMELLCFGATPTMVVDTIGNEMDLTGERIIAGLRGELDKAGLADVPLNGSTEDNMPTQTTSIGVTVIGTIDQKAIQAQPAAGALAVYQMGTPYVGEEVKAHLATIFSYGKVRAIWAHSAVVDMLPVGSKGIAYELSQMAAVLHMGRITTDLDLNGPELTRSAGPATVILVAIKISERAAFEKQFPELVEIAQLHQS